MTEFNSQEQSCVINKDSIIFNALIGEGGFGRVLSGMLIQNRTWYAIKEINKYNVTEHQTGISMLFSELKALQAVNVEPQCSFIVSLQAAFHDRTSCYLMLDLKGGGDLRFYLRKRLIFEESDVAFYVACIGSALEFIHSRNILHRDVKPENIILDSRGYPHLTDFGVAYVQPEGTEGVLTCTLASGTKQYLAPEVYCKSNVHGIASDYWSLGVLAFELLFGQRPFEKHCPSLHIAYLEESLKRTSAKSAMKKELMRDKSQSGSSSSSPHRSQKSLKSDPSSPTQDNTHSTRSRCSTSNMTTASTQKTEALQTRDALFSKKRRDLRFFPESSTGVVGYSASVKRMGSFSILEECQKTLPLGDEKADEAKSSYEICRTHASAPGTGPGTGAGPTTKNSEGEGEGGPSKGGSGSGVEPDVAGGAAGSSTVNSGRTRGKSHKKITLKEREEPKERNARGNENDRVSRKGEGEGKSEGKSEKGERKGDGGGEKGTMSARSKDKEHSASSHSYSQSQGGRSGDSASDLSDFDDSEYVTVDHWTVHAHELPIHLQVLVPKESDWLGEISDSCVEILKGFFDVRPSHRIGGRNLNDLKNHQWFVDCEIPDWKILQAKTYKPKFTPAKKFMRNTFWRPEALMEYQKSLLPGNTIVLPDVDIEHVHKFFNFVHSSQTLLNLFPSGGFNEKENLFDEMKKAEDEYMMNEGSIMDRRRKSEKSHGCLEVK